MLPMAFSTFSAARHYLLAQRPAVTDGEHGGDSDDRAAMDMPRPAEDDYEDGLQDMDMMPGDMGMGGAHGLS